MTSIGNPPRDPDLIEPTKHMFQMMKERNIGWHQIELAIEDRSVSQAEGEGNIMYRLDMPGVDLLVVVDTIKMNGVSAYYDDEQGATGGRL